MKGSCSAPGRVSRRCERIARALSVSTSRATGIRILALLGAAYGRSVPVGVLRHIEGASTEWRRGDKALANIRLAYAQLPRFERREDAYLLFLAASLLKSGFSPRYLMQQSVFDSAARDFDKYNSSEPRVPAGSGRESGWWTTDDTTTTDANHNIQFAAEDAEDEERREKEKDLPETERRAFREPPRKEDVEEGQGLSLQRPLVDESVSIGGEAIDVDTALQTAPSKFISRRISEVRGAIPEAQQGRITMAAAVVEDAFGSRFVVISTSEPGGYLRSGVDLRRGERFIEAVATRKRTSSIMPT
jgi:hypothetical protein